MVATRQNAKLDHFARICKGLFDRVTLSMSLGQGRNAYDEPAFVGFAWFKNDGIA